MLTKQVFVIATLLASGAAFAADTVNIDLASPATGTRAAVAAETARALAAGEIKHGPLVEMYALVSPAAAPDQRLAQRAPARKDGDTRVASAPATAK